MLALIAPVTMTVEQQELWLRAAVDALKDIRAEEVEAVSYEVRRSVTRPNQIVPEIAKLVSERRARPVGSGVILGKPGPEVIYEKYQRARKNASALDKRTLSDLYENERQELRDAGHSVRPYPAPLNRNELDAMPAEIRKLGLAHGFLREENGRLVEA